MCPRGVCVRLCVHMPSLWIRIRLGSTPHSCPRTCLMTSAGHSHILPKTVLAERASTGSNRTELLCFLQDVSEPLRCAVSSMCTPLGGAGRGDGCGLGVLGRATRGWAQEGPGEASGPHARHSSHPSHRGSDHPSQTHKERLQVREKNPSQKKIPKDR